RFRTRLWRFRTRLWSRRWPRCPCQRRLEFRPRSRRRGVWDPLWALWGGSPLGPPLGWVWVLEVLGAWAWVLPSGVGLSLARALLPAWVTAVWAPGPALVSAVRPD